MTAVSPLTRFNIVRKCSGVRQSPPACRQVAVIGIAETADLSSDVSEPYADQGELLASVSPMLFSMKLFGLFFCREDQHRRRTGDPEWNETRRTGHASSNWLRVYSTVFLTLVWLNAVRLVSLFTTSDHFGVLLLMKITVFVWFTLSAIMYTAFYFASHTGQLLKVLLTLPVTPDCVRKTRLIVVGLIIALFVIAVLNMSILAYVYFFSIGGEYDFTLAPLITYIGVPEDKITVARVGGYLVCLIILPGTMFTHAMSLVLIYVFCHQFQTLKKNFQRVVRKPGHFSCDLASFRRRHQALSRAVDKVDGFLMISNVGGFVCHVAIIILVLYSLVFYRNSTATPVSAIMHIFWLHINVHGLLFSASAAIMVNHMVSVVYI